MPSMPVVLNQGDTKPLGAVKKVYVLGTFQTPYFQKYHFFKDFLALICEMS